MSAPDAPILLGAKRKGPNKKLFAVLGVILALAGGFELTSGSLGGGGGAPTFHPASNFHILRKARTVPPSAGPAPAGNALRDPFGPPPGYSTNR